MVELSMQARLHAVLRRRGAPAVVGAARSTIRHVLTRLLPVARPQLAPRRLLLMALLAAASLGAASAVVAILESQLAIPDASTVYIVAVVVMATVFGTMPAALTAAAAFVLYDYFFTQPFLTLFVSDSVEWVNLVLFLLIAVVVGRLAALQQERAADADRRAREARAVFAISRTLATASTVAEAAPAVLARLALDSGTARVWFAVGAPGAERTLLDSAPEVARPRPRSHWMLLRTPGDKPAQWLRTHVGADASMPPGRPAPSQQDDLFRVKIEADGSTVGSLWATRPTQAGVPNREETRLLALAADQLGLAVRRDELSAAATAAEVARQSDALKSALLTSVSHDLRTPLAGIRAAAGSLMDPEVPWSADGTRETARAIDVEADRLNRLVQNLLDLSRIEAGVLRPDHEALDLEDLVESVVARLAPLFDGRSVEVDLPPNLPPVRGDAVYLDQVLANLLENAARHAGRGARVLVSARVIGAGTSGADAVVALLIEDSGPGVAAEALPRIFEKFQRVARGADESRRGMGVGLSLVQGFVAAMGGTVRAGRSVSLGGLAVEIHLPVDELPLDADDPIRPPAEVFA